MSFSRIPPLTQNEIIVTLREIPPRTLVLRGIPPPHARMTALPETEPSGIRQLLDILELDSATSRRAAVAALGTAGSHRSSFGGGGFLAPDALPSFYKPYFDRGAEAIPDLVNLLKESADEQASINIAKVLAFLGGGSQAMAVMRSRTKHDPGQRVTYMRVIQFIGGEMEKARKGELKAPRFDLPISRHGLHGFARGAGASASLQEPPPLLRALAKKYSPLHTRPASAARLAGATR